METLGSTFVDPFQGPRGAENALKLAGVLAPRINLSGRPLQPGEGEGLRNLFGAFGQFAEQKRRKGAEEQLLSGVHNVMSGTQPFSSLPFADLPVAMQQVLLEQVIQQSKKGEPSMSDRIALLNALGTINDRGGNPYAALAAFGIAPFGTRAPEQSDTPRPVASSPQGPITHAPESELAPLLSRQTSSATAAPPPEIFGLSESARQWQSPPSSTDALKARTISKISEDPLKRLNTIQIQTDTPADMRKGLNDSLHRIQTKETQIWGGVSSDGFLIPPMPGATKENDVIDLLRLKSHAQVYEDQLARMEGRAPLSLYDHEAFIRIRNDWLRDYKKLPTIEQAYRQYAQELIKARGTTTTPQESERPRQ